MWGSSFGVLTAVIVAGLLLLVAALTAWTPLFAIAIAAVVIAGFAVFHAIRGGREEAEAGSAGSGELATPADEPEHQPRKGSEVAAGVWGEKREA